MGWWDKQITFKIGKDKIKEKPIKKKASAKIKIPVYLFEYSLLIYFIGLIFFPELIAPATGFLIPFMGLIYVLYTIFLTFINFFMGFAVVIIILMTYTNKLDNHEKEPTLPDIPHGMVMFLFMTIKSCLFIYLSFTVGYGYLAVLLSMSLLFGLFYKYIERDFVAKMVKLTLAWEEPLSK